MNVAFANRKVVLKITFPHPGCSCEPLLQRRVPGGDDQRAPVGQTVQADAPDLLWARPCQHAPLVLRPGAEQAGRARGDEVGHEGGLHVQRHQRRLLCRGREVAAAAENLDGVSSQPGNGVWLSQPESHLLQHQPGGKWKRNEASAKVVRVFSSCTTITCRAAAVPSETIVGQDQPSHARMWRQKNFLGENSEQRR